MYKKRINFFEKILLEKQAPRTYQHQHLQRRTKPRYKDYEGSALTIQRAWRKFKQNRLMNRIMQLEHKINVFGQPRQQGNFQEYIIERLIYDLSISERIINKLQGQVHNINEQTAVRDKEVKLVLDEYLQFIDTTLQQKYALEKENSQLREQILHKPILQLNTLDVKENIQGLSNKVDRIQNGQEDILITLQQLVNQKDNLLRERDSNHSQQISELQSIIKAREKEIKHLQSQLQGSTIDSFLNIEKELRDIQQSYQATLWKLTEV